MNSEAKTIKEMTAGQALQLTAVIVQSLGKIGLNFDLAEMLINKPSITRRRLSALKGECTTPSIPHEQYATIKDLNVDVGSTAFSNRWETEYLILGKELESVMRDDENPTVGVYGDSSIVRKAHRCDIVNPSGETLHRLFREAFNYHGSDVAIWRELYERGAFWTIGEVIDFICEEIHTGDDWLMLKEVKGEAIFPVILTEENDAGLRRKTYGRFGILTVVKGLLREQKQTWIMNLIEGDCLRFHRKTVYFASNPRGTTK